MENNNNVNDLIEEGKKQLASLEAELTKLTATAGKIIDIKGGEAAQKAEALINETKSQIESKTKEIRESENFQNLEADGKKAVADIELKLTELSAQFETVTQDLGNKLKDFFGK